MDARQNKSTRVRWIGLAIGLAILVAVFVVTVVDDGGAGDQMRAEERAQEVVAALNTSDLERLCELLAPLEGNLFTTSEVPDGASDEDRLALATPQAYERCEQEFAEDQGKTADLTIESVEVDDEVDGYTYATVIVSGTVDGKPIPPGSPQQILDLVKVGDEWYNALTRVRTLEPSEEPSGETPTSGYPPRS